MIYHIECVKVYALHKITLNLVAVTQRQRQFHSSPPYEDDV